MSRAVMFRNVQIIRQFRRGVAPYKTETVSQSFRYWAVYSFAWPVYLVVPCTHQISKDPHPAQGNFSFLFFRVLVIFGLCFLLVSFYCTILSILLSIWFYFVYFQIQVNAMNDIANNILHQSSYFWTPGTDPCSWTGVTCDQTGVAITRNLHNLSELLLALRQAI